MTLTSKGWERPQNALAWDSLCDHQPGGNLRRDWKALRGHLEKPAASGYLEERTVLLFAWDSPDFNA